MVQKTKQDAAIARHGRRALALAQNLVGSKNKMKIGSSPKGSSTGPRMSVGWRSLQKTFSRSGSAFNKKEDSKEDDSAFMMNFHEFLHLMKEVRTRQQEADNESLRTMFDYYDADKSGEVSSKEMGRLFQDLGLQPRSRQEQLEIKKIFDEVDDDGSRSFGFSEFCALVQRSRERLERLFRVDEEKYAISLGIPMARVRELRKVFKEHKCQTNVAGRAPGVICVPELRKIMNHFQRWYSSDEIHQLFHEFSREDLEGIDSKGFLRMMHAIEIACTAGKYQQGKRVKPKPPVDRLAQQKKEEERLRAEKEAEELEAVQQSKVKV
eukprot:TRINITY_DN26398_c0_g1_i1.p1 TRINITY_DN26398_c0_g1~~TRINITY_DN26398_c0_g1_i1.p1  ORF type:complete len:323 (+),score=81.16 TRINITY_DN26398_c0_g1_i1:219-1187(+)